MADHRFEILDRTPAYEGYFRIDRYRLHHSLFAGGMSGEIVREVFERGHAVGLLPYDPGRDEVVLIEQFRVGALAAGWEPWLLEVVAGIIDPGETPEAVALRETEEEAGTVVLGDLVHCCDYLVSPGGTSETVRLFCGRIDTGAIGTHGGKAEEDEDIRIHVVPADQAIAWLDEGRIVNSVSVISLHWLARHRDALRRRWLTDDTR